MAAGTGNLNVAVIGQSENETGWAINKSFWTTGPYPTLLPGVDAKIALQAATDKSGADTIRTLTQAEIDARNVSPGFVALANLWHVGSGGRPLRLLDVCKTGSSANQMFDAQNTSRDTAADIAVITFAEAAWGPTHRVVYNWWNSESGVAQTLRRDRFPHLLGRNEDGTPYDFTQAAIDYCAIDTTGRGYGMFPDAAKLDLMLPGITVQSSETLYNPPHRNYRYKADGTDNHGRIRQNGEPANEERKLFMAAVPQEVRGAVTLTPAVCLFGDYQGGVKKSGAAETNIHPALQSEFGQILFSQHVGMSFLIAERHARASRHLRTETASDGSHADLVFEMANGGSLTTMRKLGIGDPATAPRPHQQLDGMGFVIYRSGDTKWTGKPLYRADATDAALYPAAYRGTVKITDTGTNIGGRREARVRITPVVPFTNGDTILLGDDGGYGAFILHGWPDYDARLFLDCLIEHIPLLYTDAGYPGLPIEPQVRSAVALGNVTAPPPSVNEMVAVEVISTTSDASSYSGTVNATAANGILMVADWHNYGPNSNFVTGVTFDGQAMTKVGEGWRGGMGFSAWRVDGVKTGPGTITVDCSSATRSMIAVYTPVAGSTAGAIYSENAGDVGPISTSQTAAAGDRVITMAASVQGEMTTPTGGLRSSTGDRAYNDTKTTAKAYVSAGGSETATVAAPGNIGVQMVRIPV